MEIINTTATVAERLNAICDAQPFVVRYAIRNLRNGAVFERGADEETPSASTRKTSAAEGGSPSPPFILTNSPMEKRCVAMTALLVGASRAVRAGSRLETVLDEMQMLGRRQQGPTVIAPYPIATTYAWEL